MRSYVVGSLLVLSSVLIPGCSTGTGIQPVYQRDGMQVYEAKCNGLARSISYCHAQASNMCNGKYREVGVDGTSSFVPLNGRYMPVNHRSLSFVCIEDVPPLETPAAATKQSATEGK